MTKTTGVPFVNRTIRPWQFGTVTVASCSPPSGNLTAFFFAFSSKPQYTWQKTEKSCHPFPAAENKQTNIYQLKVQVLYCQEAIACDRRLLETEPVHDRVRAGYKISILKSSHAVPCARCVSSWFSLWILSLLD